MLLTDAGELRAPKDACRPTVFQRRTWPVSPPRANRVCIARASVPPTGDDTRRFCGPETGTPCPIDGSPAMIDACLCGPPIPMRAAFTPRWGHGISMDRGPSGYSVGRHPGSEIMPSAYGEG